MPQKYIENGKERYLIADQVGFDKAIDNLQADYKKTLDAHQDFMNSVVEVDLLQLTKEDLPEGITPAQLARVFQVIG